jgi:hypothetical protein
MGVGGGVVLSVSAKLSDRSTGFESGEGSGAAIIASVLLVSSSFVSFISSL